MPNTVIDWRNRFAVQGISGLYDRPRSGKPPKYDEEFRARVLKTLELPPPRGQSCWDGPSVAQHPGASDDAVWRVLRKQNICLARQRSWCVSTDPEFASKAADIVGLYLAPPEKALVISVDEKPNVQALERTTGYKWHGKVDINLADHKLKNFSIHPCLKLLLFRSRRRYPQNLATENGDLVFKNSKLP